MFIMKWPLYNIKYIKLFMNWYFYTYRPIACFFTYRYTPVTWLLCLFGFSVWTGIRWSVPPQISSWWWSMCLGENCLITSSNTARYSFISLLAAEQMTLTFCMCIIPYTSRNLHSDMQQKMLILVNCTCSLWYNLCLCLKTNTFYKVENIKLSVVLHTCRIKDKSDCRVTVV